MNLCSLHEQKDRGHDLDAERQRERLPARTERKPYCFGCYATVEVRIREPQDWRLGAMVDYNPGTNTPHDCIQMRRFRCRKG